MIDMIASLGVMLLSVSTGSMIPALDIGEPFTLVAAKYYPLDLLKEGDIISFKVPDPEGPYEGIEGMNIVHRIVDIEYEDGLVVEIQTQGDNNDIIIDGVDLTEDIEREELLLLYNGIVYEGDRLAEMEAKYQAQQEIVF